MGQLVPMAFGATEDDASNPVIETALAERGDQIIRSYTRRHALLPVHTVTRDMIRTHYYTERRLARGILLAAEHDRAETARQAYTEFYATCFWLGAWRRPETDAEQSVRFAPFLHLLRRHGPSVYEIGSGSGTLARFLCRHGLRCVATEISASRPDLAEVHDDGLAWHVSDGIRLRRYEPANHYDAVVSSQVIEHLHPDDINEHFANAFDILRPGGAYVFDTPNRLSGPRDISALFGLERSECFHLMEYTYSDFSRLLSAVGFSRVMAVYSVPRSIRAKAHGRLDRPLVSSTYLKGLLAAEAVLGGLSLGARKTVIGAMSAIGVWRPNVFLAAVK